MGLLIAGVLTWALVHFIPSTARPLRGSMIEKLGENGYKAVFTLLVLSGLAMIIFGWRSTTPSFLYQLPYFTRHIGMLLVLVGFILFGAAKYQTRIKRVIRHPQLTGVFIWAVAHLIMNGDNRSIVLFGGLGLWAILEIILINRREKEWIKPDAPAWSLEIRGLVVSLVVFGVFVFLHPYIAGIAIR